MRTSSGICIFHIDDAAFFSSGYKRRGSNEGGARCRWAELRTTPRDIGLGLRYSPLCSLAGLRTCGAAACAVRGVCGATGTDADGLTLAPRSSRVRSHVFVRCIQLPGCLVSGEQRCGGKELINAKTIEANKQ